LAIHTIQESNALLLYKVGPVLVCSPTISVEAVVMPPKLTVPPGASVAEPGVFKSIHGLVRLVDLRVRFGVNEDDFSTPGKIVIVEVEGGHAGFWVDEIEDVISFPSSGWADVPLYIPRNIFSRTLLQKESIRLYADFEQLDKFKTTGYLKKYIEKIKCENQKNIDDSNELKCRENKKDYQGYSKKERVETEVKSVSNIGVRENHSNKQLDKKEIQSRSLTTAPKKSNSIKRDVDEKNKTTSADKIFEKEKILDISFTGHATTKNNFIKCNDFSKPEVAEKNADVKKKYDTPIFSGKNRESVAVKKTDITNNPEYASPKADAKKELEKSVLQHDDNLKDNKINGFLWLSIATVLIIKYLQI